MAYQSKVALEQFLEIIKNADATFLDPEKNLDDQGKVDGYHLANDSLEKQYHQLYP